MSIDVAAVLRDALPAGTAPHRLSVFGPRLPDSLLAAVQALVARGGWQIRSSQFEAGVGFETNVWELTYDDAASPPTIDVQVAAGTLRDEVRSALGLQASAGTAVSSEHGRAAGLSGFVGFALVKGALAQSGPKMLIMDVDSTLIQQEVIELLAARAGVEEQVRTVTEAAMRGELDFAQSLHERVATLAGLPASVIDEVVAEVSFTPGARELIASFRDGGHVVGVVSGGFRQILDPLAEELALDHYLANELEIIDGRLTGRVLGAVVDAHTKARKLSEWSGLHGIEETSVIAVGDGANDIPMVNAAGLGVAFNAKPALRGVADVELDIPSLAPVQFFAELG